MKLNLVLLTAAFAKDKQKYCDDDCDELINRFKRVVLQNGQNNDIFCERYEDWRSYPDKGSHCSQRCKIQCTPSENKCPGASNVSTPIGDAMWVYPIQKAMKYAETEYSVRKKRAANWNNQDERDAFKEERRARNEADRQERKKERWMEMYGVSNWWRKRRVFRDEKRAENQNARAEQKEKRKKLAAAKKAAESNKEYYESRRAARRFKKDNRNLFSFYDSIAKSYKKICPYLKLYPWIRPTKGQILSAESQNLPVYLNFPEWEVCSDSKKITGFKQIWRIACVPRIRPENCSSDEQKGTYERLSTETYGIYIC